MASSPQAAGGVAPIDPAKLPAPSKKEKKSAKMAAARSAAAQAAKYWVYIYPRDLKTKQDLDSVDMVVKAPNETVRLTVPFSSLAKYSFTKGVEYTIDFSKDGFLPILGFKLKSDSPYYWLGYNVSLERVQTGGITLILMDSDTKNVAKFQQEGTIRLSGPAGEKSLAIKPGSFSATVYNLPYGKYNFEANVPGYLPAAGEVSLAEQMANPRIFLKPGSAPQRVKVVNENGQPVAGAAIQAIGAGKAPARFQTDQNGAASLDLSSGTYAFTASAAGFQPASTGTLQLPLGKELTIRLGRLKGRLLMTIQDETTNAPVTEASVALSGPQGSFKATSSRLKGVAEFKELPLGAYRLLVQKPGYHDKNDSLDHTTNLGGSWNVLLKPKPLSMRVTDPDGRPVRSAAITAKAEGSREIQARTDAFGNAQLDLRSLATTLQIEAAGFEAASAGPVSLPRAAPLEVRLAPKLAFRIMAVDPYGRPVGGAKVAVSYRKRVAFRSKSVTVSAPTNASGLAEFFGDFGGMIFVTVSAPGYLEGYGRALAPSGTHRIALRRGS
jgi:hypothetical protein